MTTFDHGIQHYWAHRNSPAGAEFWTTLLAFAISCAMRKGHTQQEAESIAQELIFKLAGMVGAAEREALTAGPDATTNYICDAIDAEAQVADPFASFTPFRSNKPGAAFDYIKRSIHHPRPPAPDSPSEKATEQDFASTTDTAPDVLLTTGGEANTFAQATANSFDPDQYFRPSVSKRLKRLLELAPANLDQTFAPHGHRKWLAGVLGVNVCTVDRFKESLSERIAKMAPEERHQMQAWMLAKLQANGEGPREA